MSRVGPASGEHDGRRADPGSGAQARSGTDASGADASGADASGADLGSAADAEEFVADVLELVAAIPAGRVLTYGDVAAAIGRGGPRQVGRVMSRWGSAVPWWRVLRADGRPPPGHETRALARYRDEGTPLRPGGERVDLRRARWDPDA